MAIYGVNFRASSGYVTDPADHTYSLGETYPTTRSGLTFGWSAVVAETRNRNSGIDARLAGVNFVGAPSSHYFRLDLPSGAGDYNVRVAAGDAGSSNTVEWDFRDGAGSTLFSTTGVMLLVGNFKDATDVQRTAAAWPGSNVAQSVTFANDHLRVYLGAGATVNVAIAHVSVEPAGGGGGVATGAAMYRHLQAMGAY